LPEVLPEHESVAVPAPPERLVDESVQDRLVEFVVKDRVTVPAKPLTPAIVTVEVPEEPAVTVTLAGPAVAVKSCT